MSDFMDRARAEAERRWSYFINQHGWENTPQACNFMEGAAWARDVLLTDLTDAEVDRQGAGVVSTDRLNSALNAGRGAVLDLSFGHTPVDAKIIAENATKAAWPILSAGLRRLHEASTSADYAGDCMCGLRYPCPTARELDRIDKELGND